MADDRDFTSYVAARWTYLVRGLVALGATPTRAHRVAEDALSSCHDDWDARDEWADLDVHVLGVLLDRWDRDRGAWWEEPVPASHVEALAEAGWPRVEAELDRLTVPERRALVMRVLAGLSEEQALELTGVDGRRPDAPPDDEVRMALELVQVEPPPVESMIAASERRRRRRWGVSIAAVVALLAATGVVTALALRPSDPPAAAPGTLDPVPSIPYDNPSPVAWYAVGRLYLPHSQVPVLDVREFGQWDDGAVYLDIRGHLIAVTGDGQRERIATLGPGGTFAVSDTTDRVVWIDPEGSELVIHDLETGERRVERRLSEERARVLTAQQYVVYLSTGDDMSVVSLNDGSIRPVQDWRLPGELDRHGRYVLTREAAGPRPRIRLHDTSSSPPRQLPLPLVDTRAVTEARFGPDGSVIMLFEPPQSPVWEVRICAPPYDTCSPVEWFPAGGAPSLLAQ